MLTHPSSLYKRFSNYTDVVVTLFSSLLPVVGIVSAKYFFFIVNYIDCLLYFSFLIIPYKLS